MQAMRIGSQPSALRRLGLGQIVISNLAIEDLVFLEVVFFVAPLFGIGRRVPAPLRQRAQGNGIGKKIREGLQTGRISGKSKFAIAD